MPWAERQRQAIAVHKAALEHIEDARKNVVLNSPTRFATPPPVLEHRVPSDKTLRQSLQALCPHLQTSPAARWALKYATRLHSFVPVATATKGVVIGPVVEGCSVFLCIGKFYNMTQLAECRLSRAGDGSQVVELNVPLVLETALAWLQRWHGPVHAGACSGRECTGRVLDLAWNWGTTRMASIQGRAKVIWVLQAGCDE